MLPVATGLLLSALLTLGGCRGLQGEAPAPEVADATAMVDAAAVADAARAAEGTGEAPAATDGSASGEPVVQRTTAEAETAPAAEAPASTSLSSTNPDAASSPAALFAKAPVALTFADLDLTVPVEVMSWRNVRVSGVRTTRWNLPEDAAGWHPNSAAPGEPGTTIISGSQLGGDGVFTPIALGEVTEGQNLLLATATGAELRYTVTSVSDPLAIEGDPEAAATLLDLLAPTAESRLVLLTGWPDFTTTHRIAVVAELAPVQP